MKYEYLDFLFCPTCHTDLKIEKEVLKDNKIITASLVCKNCNINFPVLNYIPRFINTQSYADSFGAQWNAFAEVQLDDQNTLESALRFDSEIGWDEKKLSDKSIIEIGSGAGRFVDVVSRKKAKLVVGIDVTSAVDAAQNNLIDRDNVFFIQADVFNLPIKNSYFDFVYSIGVLHHTPNPQLAFESMVDKVKEDGGIGLSLYEISLYSRPNRNHIKVSTIDLLWSLNLWRVEFFRIFTTRLPDKYMIIYCKAIIPILHHINKIPVIGLIRYIFPSTCYRKLPVFWSMLDTMDTYSTKIVHQYRAKDLFQWFLKLGLNNIILMNGRAGWVSLVADKGNLHTRNSKKLVMERPQGIGNIGD
jgi:SAM-dependent methyltransferase